MEDPADLDRLAEDWIALWQSEIAGLAADPELAEQWAAWAALGRGLDARGHRHGAAGAPRMTAPAAPPWTPPAAPAPGPGGHAGAGGDDQPGPAAAGRRPARACRRRPPGRAAMADRLAELERRLADLEGGPGGAGANPRRPRRRRPPRLRPCRAPSCARLLRADRALIAGIAAYRRHPFSARRCPTRRRSGPRAGRGCSTIGGRWAAGAVRALPGQPRLCAGPGARTVAAALAGRAGRSAAAARLGLAGRGGAAASP